MYRFLRWVVWIAGVFFVFIILAIIAVQIFLSSDEIIRIAEREGQKILGRTISIERLNLGLYKIKASGVVIRGEKEKGGVKSKPFARFNDVELFLNPSALIYKHISILQLTIKGVSAHAHRDANGRFNFQDIVDNLNRWTKKTASAGAKNTRMLFPFIRAAEAAESSKQSVESGFNLTIHELDLHNVKTELRFDTSDTTPAFESLCSFAHIEVDEIKSDEPLDVFLDGKCQNSGGQQLIQLMGDAHINTKGRNYRASFAIPLFDSSVLATVAPIVGGYRLRKGIFAGKLGFSYVAGKPVTWDLDLNGRTIHADFQMNRKAVWQRLILPSLKLKTKGQFDLLESSARIETFFVETPFLNAKLTKPIFWNASAKDEVHVEANIRDMGEMGSWVSRITDIPLPELKEGATAQILVSAKRIRKIQDDFVHVEIKSHFDPVDLARFSAFIPPVDNLSKIKGNVSGKARVVFISGDRVEWDVALEAQDFGASVRMEQKKRWEVLELGRAILHSRGNFDMKNESARINALKIKLPFATAKLERPAKWNVNGMDSIRFQWTVSSLEDAARLARSILGDPASKFLVAGGADGLVEISRSRKKTHSISTKWSFAANLSALAHVAYPNLNLTGSVLGQGDDDAINIRIPTLKTINSSKPNSEPDVILRDLSASLNRSSILRGEIRSPSVRINKLNVRYVRHEKGKTNFGSLFKAAKAEEKQTWRMRSRDKTAPTDTRTTSRKPRMAGKKDNGHLFPAIKITKFEVARLGFHFQDFIAANKPPVVLKVPDARLSITNLDTLMAPNLRETRLEFRTLGESPSLLAKANLNPGLAPPDVDGFFNLSRFDLRKISPYVRDIQGESASALLMRGTEIKKGMLDFKSTYSLRKSQLELEGKAKIAGLRLEPDETFPLADLVVKLLRASVFRLFERPDDTISLNLRVSGRLDDPEFHFLDAIVEPMFVGLFEQAQNLGGNLKDIVTGILGTAIEGVQKIVPAPKSSGAPPVEGTRKEPDGKGNQLEQLGKKLEKTLQKGLRGLFGVK